MTTTTTTQDIIAKAHAITDTPEHRATLYAMAREIADRTDHLAWTEAVTPDELDGMEMKPSELLYALYRGDFDACIDYRDMLVRFDGDGHAETVDMDTLEEEAYDNREDVVYFWHEYADSLDTDGIDEESLYADED